MVHAMQIYMHRFYPSKSEHVVYYVIRSTRSTCTSTGAVARYRVEPVDLRSSIPLVRVYLGTAAIHDSLMSKVNRSYCTFFTRPPPHLPRRTVLLLVLERPELTRSNE